MSKEATNHLKYISKEKKHILDHVTRNPLPGFIFDTVFRFYSFHQEGDDASTFSKLQLKLWKVFAGTQVNGSGPKEAGHSHVGGQ